VRVLQAEIGRKERALHYHNFALMPLVFVAELVSDRGLDLYRENGGAIRRLADLVIAAVENESSFSAITPVPQQLFPWTFTNDLAWTEPYYARFRPALATHHGDAATVLQYSARRQRDGTLCSCAGALRVHFLSRLPVRFLHLGAVGRAG
jgi:hypothetical protein